MPTLRRPHSIRLRLIVLVLAVFVPALLVGLWVVSLTHQLAREANQRRLEDSARALSMVLNLELAQRAAVVRALSLSRMLDTAPDLRESTLRAFDDQARRALTGLQGWLEVRTADRMLVNTRLPPGELPQARGLSPPGALFDAPQVLAMRDNPQVGIRHASLVHPVLREGRAVLNLTLTMLPQEFQSIVDQQQLQGDWVAAIVDSEGHLVARHPLAARDAGPGTPGPFIDPFSAMPFEQGAGLVHTQAADGAALTIYVSNPAQGWTFITGMPRAQFEGVVSNDMRNLALGTLLLLTLAVLAALWVARSLVRPICSIKAMAQDMQDGRIVEAASTGISECDDVAQAMERASQSIHGAQLEMEQRVDQAVALTRRAEERMAHSHRLEALGRLTGGLAHDFNNLLGVISNSVHLMLRKTQDPALTAPAQATLRAVTSGGRLTQHLLRFSGRHAVQPCAIHLDVFLPEAAELMRAVMGRHIELTLALDPATPTVFADPHELELSLINLALNARDAIADRGCVVVQTARPDPQDSAGVPEQDRVVISVTDDGSGMAEDVARRVFEPFFSTKGFGQATGLGLSQVYGFCQQSGGTVQLHSTPGLGTTVSLTLPARSAAPQAPMPADGVALSGITGTRVLLVEDNEELRAATSALLASFGCKVTSKASAQEALGVLQKQGDIDVMLTDVLMPGPMNGVCLARHVIQRYPDLPIVMISGHRGDAGDLDGFPFVQKPCTPQTLVTALQQATRRHRRQPSAVA